MAKKVMTVSQGEIKVTLIVCLNSTLLHRDKGHNTCNIIWNKEWIKVIVCILLCNSCWRILPLIYIPKCQVFITTLYTWWVRAKGC